jgi:octaprenyl-diphosphate synthase
VFELIASEIKTLENLLVEYLKTPNAPTNQIIGHIFDSGGKRIRPSLFLLVCQLVGYSGEHKYPIASVCEYIHTASLLHDDVIDNSSVRRNKPTTNSIWGDETAVLAGDLIYSSACRIMVKTRSLELIDTFAECIRFMSESELFQLEMLWNENITQTEYFKIVHGKTAVLFEACTKTPAFLAQLTNEESVCLAKIGFHLGMAFQIADDCFDFEGNKDIVGKNLEADLKEGKCTLPVIIAQKNNPHLKKLVSEVFDSHGVVSEKIDTILNLIKQSEGILESKKIAKNHIQFAEEAIELWSVKFDRVKNEPAKKCLKDLCFFILNRKN